MLSDVCGGCFGSANNDCRLCLRRGYNNMKFTDVAVQLKIGTDKPEIFICGKQFLVSEFLYTWTTATDVNSGKCLLTARGYFEGGPVDYWLSGDVKTGEYTLTENCGLEIKYDVS